MANSKNELAIEENVKKINFTITNDSVAVLYLRSYKIPSMTMYQPIP